MRRVSTLALLSALALGTAGCGSGLIEGLITPKLIPDAPDSASPVSEITHGHLSALPTSIAFKKGEGMGVEEVPGWVREELSVEIVPGDSFLGPDDARYVRFHQIHAGLPVRGAGFRGRVEGGVVVELTGLLHGGIDIEGTPELPSDQAFGVVREQAPGFERIGDATLEILPLEPDAQVRFALVYRFRLFDPKEGMALSAFIDARSGELRAVTRELVSFLPPIATGEGETTDGRTVTFETQHTSDIPPPPEGEIEIVDVRQGFRLFDPNRNLHTMSLGGRTDVITYTYEEQDGITSLTDFDWYLPGYELIEDDNVWESTPHAVDVHWGMTVAYDYFLGAFGRQGWDGANGYFPAFVDYYRDVANAYYHPGGHFMAFGDGGRFGRPITFLETIVHEYSHAVSQSIVGWMWRGEAASVNEALSDIFATHQKFTAGTGNWVMAASFGSGYARSLADPNSTSLPDTYEGDHWATYRTDFELSLGLQDQSGHQNSTIMSHWFYLLSEGGEGESDHGEEYDIDGIGIEKAVNIVYRSLFRMNSSVDFKSARAATLQVARRRYGRCSDELRDATNAWNAVGVGDPYCACFEGSFTLLTDSDEGPRGVKLYIRGDDYAAEATAEDGSTAIMYSTAGDPYWHVKGAPDMPADTPANAALRWLFQGRRSLIRPPSQLMSRREYLQYRNQHRTGRTRELGEFTCHEYRVDNATVWSTEEVCLDMTDFGALMMPVSSGTGDMMRQVLFGFPVSMEAPGQGRYWVEDLREHEVDDSFFSG